MFPIIPSNGAVTGFQIANSLRFRSSASAYLNRTPGSAGSQTTWTWSVWVKRGQLSSSAYFVLIDTNNGSAGTPRGAIQFVNDTLEFSFNSTGSSWDADLITTQVFRDPSAWYHIVVIADTTQATSSNRLKMYVNGTQITAFSTATYPAQNTNTPFNYTYTYNIGRSSNNINYFDGYLTEINFIDGQALTPSSFGETDAVTGVWKPKAYSGTYGTNGFRLNFSNGTSTTTLGYDSSGNSNNWTTNNISLTAGSTYDWMIDSPTKYPGSSYGVGNYAVLNPLDPNVSGLSVTLSNGNLTASGSTYGANVYTASMQIPSSGKWYYETVYSTITSTVVVGIRSYTTGSTDVQYRSDGQKTVGSTTNAYGSSWTTNDVIAVAVDRDAGTVTFYKNNTSQGAISIPTNSAIFDMAWGTASPYGSTTFAVTFGQRPFAYTPPSGYKSLCTFNLPAASITNGAQYMAATLYTGNGSTLSVSNTVNSVSFQPDLVWVKSRSNTYQHALYDSVRGAQKWLSSSSTSSEITQTGLTAFDSTGFTLGSDAGNNGSGATFVGWQWKAGGTAVTNTAGSITSQVSANTTSGFAVVTYTGTGANATVGHGLGIAPNMMILKRRSVGGEDWAVYNSSLANAATTLALNNSAAAVGGNATTFNSTAPTSTVFSLGTNDRVNTSSVTYVAYCFAAIAGYSAFGSYTGNGSADGPFVYTGFRPRYVLIKASSVVDNWDTFDTSRDVYNATTRYLYSNLSNIEDNYTAYPLDILSNGFKIRNASYPNQSSVTYIYAAFAENPFQNALAR